MVPVSKRERVLLASASLGELPYIKAPHLIVLRDGTVLVGHKRGTKHNQEPIADWEVRTLNKESLAFTNCTRFPSPQGASFQNGEFIEYSNGDIEIFLDRQRCNELLKKGLVRWRSVDGGASWKPMGELGNIGGKVYAYAFQGFDLAKMNALVATTHRIPESNSSQVDILITDDNGLSWHRHCSLTERLGDGDILNESWIIPYDADYIVVCRCLDQEVRIYRLNKEFELLRKRNLTREVEAIPAYLGRPVLINKDGEVYLMGRNFGAPLPNGRRRACLGLLRINPDTLLPESNTILDNWENREVQDGYYARPFWRKNGDRLRFEVITYRLFKSDKDRPGPDLLLFDYDWNEIAN